MARYKTDLLGVIKGYITVVDFHEKRGKTHYWKCECKCGKKLSLPTGRISSDYFPSCGCYRKEQARFMPKYSKTIINDETLASMTRDEAEPLIKKVHRLKKGQAKYIYDLWRKDYVYSKGQGFYSILQTELHKI